MNDQQLLPTINPSENDLIERALSMPLDRKIEKAVTLLQEYEQDALKLYDGGFWVCAGKHHGDANSEAAFKTGNKENDERVIFELITSSGDGITIHEACSALNKHPNQISGRFTSLKLKGLVCVNGKRNGAGVHYAKV